LNTGFKIFQIRPDVDVRAVYESNGLRYVIADSIGGSTFQLNYFQYLIAKFFQANPTTSSHCSEHLLNRHEVEIEPESIEKFLYQMGSHLFLEADRHLQLNARQVIAIRTRIYRALDHFKTTQIWTSVQQLESVRLQKFSELLEEGDVIGAFETAKSIRVAHSDLQICRELENSIREALCEELHRAKKSDSKNQMFIRQIKLYNPDRLLGFLKPGISLLFSKIGLLLMLLLYGLGWLIIMKNSDFWFGEARTNFASAINADMYIFAIGIFSTFGHEMGHAAVCYHFGGKVRRMGIFFYMGFVPYFFTDVSSAYFFPRNRRLMVMAAGASAQLILWMCGILAWSLAPTGSLLRFYLTVLVTTNSLAVLFNFLPTFKTDGYFMLTDLMGIDNMYNKAFTYCFGKTKQLFLGTKPTSQMPEVRPIEKVIFWTYVVATVAEAVLTVGVGLYFCTTNFPVMNPFVNSFYLYLLLLRVYLNADHLQKFFALPFRINSFAFKPKLGMTSFRPLGIFACVLAPFFISWPQKLEAEAKMVNDAIVMELPEHDATYVRVGDGFTCTGAPKNIGKIIGARLSTNEPISWQPLSHFPRESSLRVIGMLDGSSVSQSSVGSSCSINVGDRSLGFRLFHKWWNNWSMASWAVF
jgi:Zn-dependent protease